MNLQIDATIGQMFYPDRQAFFERLARTLPQQPAIKFAPAPLPSGQRSPGSRNLWKAIPARERYDGRLVHAIISE
jgi:hypothetical protein